MTITRKWTGVALTNMGKSVEKPIRVYLVDDHRMVRAGLRAIFEDYPEIQIVGEAPDAATALQELPALVPVVALVDLRLPDQDGCSLCRQLKAWPRPPRVLILTSFGEEEDVLAAVGSGADGYLMKTSQDAALVAAITTVATGGTVWPSLARLALQGQRRTTADGQSRNLLDSLSPQERRVLGLVAQGKTNKEIAGTFGVSEKTVRNQVSHLMRKLGVERRAQAAAYFVRFDLS